MPKNFAPANPSEHADERVSSHSDGPRAWHSRAAGDLSTWGDTYTPADETSSRMWAAHRGWVEPWIAATPTAGVTDARRVASAVLQLLGWAMPQLDDPEACMTEATLQQFVQANPNGISAGAISNVRGRVRRVLRAREAVAAGPLDGTALRGGGTGHAVAPGEPTISARPIAPTSKPAPEPPATAAPSKSALTGTGGELYDEATWTGLLDSVGSDPALSALLQAPWTPPAPQVWALARNVAAGRGIDLCQRRLRDTLNVHALQGSKRPLGRVLGELGLGRDAATTAARHLPMPDREQYAAALRGAPLDADCPPSVKTPPADTTRQCNDRTGRHSPDHLGNPAEAGSGPLHQGDPIPMPATALAQKPLSPEHTGKASPGPDTAPSPRRRKPSARQARLAAAQARAESTRRAESLPPSIQAYIRSSYQPQPKIRQDWDHLKGAVETTLAASAVRGEDSMRKHVTHLAYFFAWARSVGLALTPATLTREHVVRYETESLAGASRSTHQNRRSRLQQMADQIHPDQAPARGPVLSYPSLAPPYTDADMAVVRRVPQVQPTALLKRQMCLLVGLGAGAGIDSTDLKRLHGHNVTDHGPDIGIEVRVINLRRSKDHSPTHHHRTVWVLREYEALVRIAIEGVRPNQLLLGRDAERANVAACVYDRAALHGDVVDLAQSRLRSTWMATHLRRATPLNVLLRAAGLTTARTIVDLLDHLPEETNAAAHLR